MRQSILALIPPRPYRIPTCFPTTSGWVEIIFFHERSQLGLELIHPFITVNSRMRR